MNEAEDFLENHLEKCRCCFRSFEDSEKRIKIQKSTEKLFFDLTQLELKSSSKKYSQNICQQCNGELEQFSRLKRELIRKQKKLYDFTERDNAKNRPSRKCTEKKLSAESVNDIPHEDEQHRDQLIKFEIKQEIEALEDGSCVAFDSTAMQPRVKLERITVDEYGPAVLNQFLDSSVIEGSDDEGVDDPFEEFFKSKQKERKKRHARIVKQRKEKESKKVEKVFCTYCNRSFLKEENLQAHVDLVHFKVKNYECSKCNFKTYSASFLLGHERRMHSGIKPAPKPKEPKKPCPICGLLVSKITSHTITVHTKPKIVFCDICGFGTYSVNRLRRHMHKHLSKEEKMILATFICDICHAKVHSKTSIKSHMKNVHLAKGKLYTCHCGRSYQAESYLKVHQKSHEKK
jgi:hypothetical protein